MKRTFIEIASYLRLTFRGWKGFSRADAASMKKALLFLCVSFSSLFAGFYPSEEMKNDAGSWWKGDYATGDWLGVRTTLEDKGVEISGGYTAEVWGNTTGGLKQGAVYTGLLDFGATVDLEKLVGWKGASVSTTWLWLSGRDASEDLVGNFLTISNIAGFNTLRMLELWFQQDFFQRQTTWPAGSFRSGWTVYGRQRIRHFRLRRSFHQRHFWMARFSLHQHSRGWSRLSQWAPLASESP